MIPFSGAILRLIVNRKVSCPHAFLGGSAPVLSTLTARVLASKQKVCVCAVCVHSAALNLCRSILF